MDKPILISGIHRSGSTWLGEMISLSSQVGYVHEPFNQSHGKCVCGYDIPYWYNAVTEANEDQVRRHFDHLLRFGSQTLLSDLRNGKLKKIGVQFRRGQFDPYSAVRRHRALIKDPLALLAADWIADAYAAQVIITVRHPAAFVDSIIRKNWIFDFRNLTSQPALLEGKLSRYAEELEHAASIQGAAAGAEMGVEEQAILLWKVLHDVIISYREQYPEWLILRHEDISRNPFAHFQDLYGKLGLKFSADVRTSIEGFVNPIKETAGKRKSADNAKRWATKISPEMADRIRKGTEEVALAFYNDQDW